MNITFWLTVCIADDYRPLSHQPSWLLLLPTCFVVVAGGAISLRFIFGQQMHHNAVNLRVSGRLLINNVESAPTMQSCKPPSLFFWFLPSSIFYHPRFAIAIIDNTIIIIYSNFYSALNRPFLFSYIRNANAVVFIKHIEHPYTCQWRRFCIDLVDASMLVGQPLFGDSSRQWLNPFKPA